MAIDTRVEQDPLPTVIQEADCVGNEDSISQCPQDNNHVCLNRGAGVICPILVRGIHIIITINSFNLNRSHLNILANNIIVSVSSGNDSSGVHITTDFEGSRSTEGSSKEIYVEVFAVAITMPICSFIVLCL